MIRALLIALLLAAPLPALQITLPPAPGAPVAPAAPVAPPGMVLIPAGSTLIGTDPAQVESLGQRDPMRMTQVLGETPRHAVVVDAFFIDTTEVTNLQWRTFLDATGRKPSRDLLRYGWPDGVIPAGELQHPVTCLSLLEIRDYLAWCGRRLPTEAEWTRAARGDDARTWPWGELWDNANCRSIYSTPARTAPVGNYPAGASPYGVLDLAGNVFEWTDSPFTAFDGFRPMSWGKGRGVPQLAPEFDRDLRVIKGGDYADLRLYTRIDARIGLAPDDDDAKLGFRTARSPQDGLDCLHRALKRLGPPQFSQAGQLDDKDLFAREVTGYDDLRRVITGHRCLAFEHGAERTPPLSKVRSDARDAPLALGILVTTEPLLMERMKRDGHTQMLPAGEYVLSFKSAGESRAHKERRRIGRDLAGAQGKSGKPAAAAIAAGADGSAGGAARIDDIWQDVEFEQDIDAILFSNANHVVVGWDKALEPAEVEPAQSAGASSDSGRVWRVSFGLPEFVAKKTDRFTLEFKLAGDGLP